MWTIFPAFVGPPLVLFGLTLPDYRWPVVFVGLLWTGVMTASVRDDRRRYEEQRRTLLARAANIVGAS